MWGLVAERTAGFRLAGLRFVERPRPSLRPSPYRWGAARVSAGPSIHVASQRTRDRLIAPYFRCMYGLTRDRSSLELIPTRAGMTRKQIVRLAPPSIQIASRFTRDVRKSTPAAGALGANGGGAVRVKSGSSPPTTTSGAGSDSLPTYVGRGDGVLFRSLLFWLCGRVAAWSVIRPAGRASTSWGGRRRFSGQDLAVWPG